MFGAQPASPTQSADADDFVSLLRPETSQSPSSTVPAKDVLVVEEGCTAGQLSSGFVSSQKFSSPDAHVKLAAENVSFRVHEYLFQRESDEARALLRQNNMGGLIILDEIQAVDLTRFLEVLYCSVAEEPPLSSKDEWTSVLALAYRWNFASIRTLALRKLLPITTPVDQVVLAMQFDIDVWKPAAYLKLCAQDSWPSPEDCRRLGFEALIHFGQAWHALRASGSWYDHDREAIVVQAFGFPRDDASDEIRRLRRDAESLEQKSFGAEAQAKDARRTLWEAEDKERERRERESEVLRQRELKQATLHRQGEEKEAALRRIETDRARVQAERAELEERVATIAATEADLERLAEETARAPAQEEEEGTSWLAPAKSKKKVGSRKAPAAAGW